MNKRFLVGALLVALSTAGYAYDEVKGTWLLGGMSGVNNNFTAVQNDVNKINNSLAGKVDKTDVYTKEEADNKFASKDDVENTLAGKVDKDTFNKNNTIIQSELDKVNQKADATDARIDGIVELNKDKNNKQDTAINNNKTEIENLKDKVNKENGANNIKNEVQDNRLDKLEQNKVNKDDVENALAGKVDKDTFNKNNTIIQSELDKVNQKADATDARIDGIVELNKDKNNKQDTAINNNKTEIENLKDKVNKENGANNIKNEVQDNRLDKLEQNKVNKDEFEQATDNLQQQIDKNNHISQENDKLLNDKIDKNTSDLNDKIDANKAEADQKHDNLQQQIDKNNHISQENDKLLNDKIDKNTSDLNDKIDANKAEQADKDAAQDAEIAKGDRIDKVQNQQIGNLQSQNLEQDKNIQANKDAIAANKAEQDKVNAAQKENNEQQQAAIDKNTSDIKDHGNRLDTLENNYAQYDGRLSGLEKKVDHLDDKMNKGLSLMAAMNAVDFQNVQTGEMALGAGVGHYGNAQSVALGVAYSPVEDLTVNAKYSITAGDPDSFAVGAGATYKFKVGR